MTWAAIWLGFLGGFLVGGWWKDRCHQRAVEDGIVTHRAYDRAAKDALGGHE